MTYTIILFVLTIAVFSFVLRPLVTPRRRQLAPVPAPLADLLARRSYLVDAIRDVDFDYSMGKVTLAEYESTRGRFMREAAEVLRDLNQQSGTLDAKINREIAELQALARKSAGPLDRAEEHRE
jgi:hypothetical protein